MRISKASCSVPVNDALTKGEFDAALSKFPFNKRERQKQRLGNLGVSANYSTSGKQACRNDRSWCEGGAELQGSTRFRLQRRFARLYRFGRMQLGTRIREPQNPA
jgi:hypothetical protein